MGIEAVRDAVAGLGDDSGAGYTALYFLLAPDVTWTVVGSTKFSGTFYGQQEVVSKLMMPIALEMTQSGRLVVDNVIADADHVVLQAHGENRVAKSGAPYDNKYCIVFRVTGGQISEVTEYCDTELVTQTFGGADYAPR